MFWDGNGRKTPESLRIAGRSVPIIAYHLRFSSSSIFRQIGKESGLISYVDIHRVVKRRKMGEIGDEFDYYSTLSCSFFEHFWLAIFFSSEKDRHVVYRDPKKIIRGSRGSVENYTLFHVFFKITSSSSHIYHITFSTDTKL